MPGQLNIANNTDEDNLVNSSNELVCKKKLSKMLVNRKKLSKKLLLYFLLFELLFTIITAPFIIFYGPFTNLKKTIVGASYYSYRHQYIARIFLNDKQIYEILNPESGKPVQRTGKQDLSAISVLDKNDDIECNKLEGRKFDGYMLVVHNPSRVRIGCTSKLGVQGEKTSVLAKSYDAIAAINGGGFTDKSENSRAIWTGTGAFPEGIVIIDGEIIYPEEETDPDEKIKGNIVGLTYDGLLILGRHTFRQLKQRNIRDAVVFGPPLVINGIPQSDIDNQGIAPRTAIGQRNDGTILLLVIDGRQSLKVGATIQDVQNVMLQEGAYNAVNLDGGASSTMFYESRVINNPSEKFGERPIPTIFYVK